LWARKVRHHCAKDGGVVDGEDTLQVNELEDNQYDRYVHDHVILAHSRSEPQRSRLSPPCGQRVTEVSGIRIAGAQRLKPPPSFYQPEDRGRIVPSVIYESAPGERGDDDRRHPGARTPAGAHRGGAMGAPPAVRIAAREQ